MENGGAVDYWLRSNGRGYMVQTVGYDGECDAYSAYGTNQDWVFLGVRPAIWVSLTDNETKADTSDTTKPNETTPAPESSPASSDGINSVPNFLSVYGLTEDDVKPEHFTEFGDITTDGQSKPGEVGGSAYIVIRADPEKTQEDHIKAWFEQLCTAMQHLSEDGKLHTNATTIGTDNDKEFVLDTLFTNPLWEKSPGTMWSYACQLLGNDVKLNVSTSYNITTGEYKMSFIVFNA